MTEQEIRELLIGAIRAAGFAVTTEGAAVTIEAFAEEADAIAAVVAEIEKALQARLLVPEFTLSSVEAR